MLFYHLGVIAITIAHVLAGCLAVFLILVILLDAVETIVVPKRVNRKVRFARYFYVMTWIPWRWFANRCLDNRKSRESFLGFYGPISLLFLIATWAIALVHAFAALHWALGSHLVAADGRAISIFAELYMSGTTFFTLGLGDIRPTTEIARLLTVTEAGMGFGMLAAVIGYLPTIYQSFSSREITISLLDARGGSPPTACELIRRHSADGAVDALNVLFADWEKLAAQIMETHISYPVLCYYRSQHGNQSWIAAIAAVLDACALVMAGIEGIPDRQARLTFAMARHAMVDLTQVFGREPLAYACPRLSDEDRPRLKATLAANGARVQPGSDAELDRLRLMYEPYLVSLAAYLSMDVPYWLKQPEAKDNWTTSKWSTPH